MGQAREILVNTEKEDKGGNPDITSLREAITEANKSNADKVFINFQKPSDDKSKSWHIKPETPLPALLHKNIYINHSYPKNITIDGSTLPNSKDGARTYSLLTIGNYENISSDSSSKPNVHLRHVNLVNNVIEGEKGSNGGGGGLAAGAGMSILQGDVVLENVVFQNLQATGGKGSQSSTGARSGYSHKQYLDDYHDFEYGDDLIFINTQASGASGGTGGLPTLLGANTRSTGGRGGSSGSPKNGRQNGGAGTNGGNGGFGVGGAAGGNGGGGAAFKGKEVCTGWAFWRKCKKSPRHTWGNGGAGGQGGTGGFGAGNGANGVRGNDATRFSNKSNPGSRKPRGGNYGENGDALGAALAVLNPSSDVELINVDFVNNKAISKDRTFHDFYAIDANTRPGKITGTSVYTFEAADSNEGREFSYDQLIEDTHSYVKIKAGSGSETLSNIHTATSFNRDVSLAKIRDPEIKHRPGHADITTIRWDKPGSTLRPIEIDSSALESSINDIYKEIIPVEEETTIKNRFKERLFSAIKSAALAGHSSYSNAGDLFKASQSKYTAADEASAIKIGTGIAVYDMLSSIKEAHSAYQQEIEQNKKNLEKLNRLQKVDRRVTADPIDIGESRSVVTIKNFTIGEDTIYLEDFWTENLTEYKPVIRNGGSGVEGNERVETFEIHFSTNNNTSTKVAEVHLDPKSVQRLNSVIQQNPTGYINALLKPNTEQKQWEIGTTLTDKNRIFQSGPLSQGGPAGEIRIMERQNLATLTDVWTVDTFHYNDRIFGSKGFDKITTNGGNDFIEPSYGRDTINGGESIDWINYADLGEPIQAKGSLVKNKADQMVNTITVNNSANIDREHVLNTTLENVEVMSSFGASSFDFSAAPSPNTLSLADTSNELPGFYAMRSGSGSTIKGSPFDDRIIISLMEDENSSDYTDSKKQNILDTNYKILSNTSEIIGNGGDDYLTFAFSDQAPELSIFNIENDDKYEDFKAVINKTTDTVIALFKGIDSSHVKAIHEKADATPTPISINSGGFKYIFQETTADSLKPLADQSVTADGGETANLDEAEHHDITTWVEATSGTLNTSGTLPPRETVTSLPTIFGDRGQDTLVGNSNSDVLVGKKGDDLLIGKSGNDIFIGGAGRNHIKTGRGHDQIHLHRQGVQIIQDFNPRKDSLVMPQNFRDNLLDFSDTKITYNNQLIAKIIDV